MGKLNYKDAGVDIDEGNALVDGLKGLVKKTFSPNVLGGIGSFSGAFLLPSGYFEPVILAATDGVGTKLKLAIDSGRLDTVGIDLVAMCVNDLICNFATPMFFLDYYATGRLDKAAALAVIGGITEGCLQAECALIGGESAEMPGMYAAGDFDLAGFAVGVAERAVVERPSQARAGDVLVALPSSGIHSNGYSLVRKIITTQKLDLNTPFAEGTLLDALLAPTKIYVKTFKALQNKIRALAHITGGGLVENLPRALPQGITAHLSLRALEQNLQNLPIFDLLCRFVDERDKFKTFNMGVGMVLVADPTDADALARDAGGFILGELAATRGSESPVQIA